MDCHNWAHIVKCNFKHLQCTTMDWYDSAHTVTFKQLQCTSMSWHNWGDIEFFFIVGPNFGPSLLWCYSVSAVIKTILTPDTKC